MNKSSSHHDLIGVVWFCALLTAPLIAHLLTGGDDLSALERRNPTQRPTMDALVASPTEAPAAINAWLEDRFGFRRELIKTDTALRNTFKLTDNKSAVRGDDGWLFLSADNALKMHQGLHPFAPGEEKAWLEGVAKIKAAACGKPFVVLIGPNKHTIYPEYLTAYPRQLGDLTRLESLEQLQNSALHIVSARKNLLALKDTEQVYYKTDSHWTSIGAYSAYRSLMQGFMDEGMSLPVLPRNRVVNTGDQEFAGETYGLLGIENGAPETTAIWAIKNPRPTIELESLPDYHWLSFEAFRERVEDDPTARLLIYGDSFSFAVISYLKESFGEVTYVHYQTGEPPLKAMAGCEFDAVALIMVERALSFEMKPQPAPAN